MTAVTKVTCDGRDCSNMFYPDESMEEYEDQMLEENGWFMRGMMHYCSKCVVAVDEEAGEADA